MFDEITAHKTRSLSSSDFLTIASALRVDRGGMVHRNHFEKFWPWFLAVMRIISECRSLWVNGIIYGLISKDHAHKIVRDEKEGVFLIRFSSNRINHVALAYKDEGAVTHTVIEMTPRGFEIEVEDSERLRYTSLQAVIVNLIPLTRVLTVGMTYIAKDDLMKT
eukprot:TRINITY_DN3357_c0_g1_i1.p1 TRINITY_DN3357_c0_g1~~TRINITY_DN3357_c0_g1_i1.p1  ORF type:complete len:182 (-),score=34.98 TRINITY_DN3357_c0_g1_i1:164-655(-)